MQTKAKNNRVQNSQQPGQRGQQFSLGSPRGQINDRVINSDNQKTNIQGYNSDMKAKGRVDQPNFYRDRHQKNKSQNLLSQETKTCENQQEGFKSLLHKNMTEAQYQQACQKYEQHIVNLEAYVEKLKQQKYDREKYLIRGIKNGSHTLKPSNSKAEFSSPKMAAAFDINEYVARTNKQRQQAKQIQEKAAKLKQKQKLERTLLKKMRQKNEMLKRSHQFNMNSSEIKSNMEGSIISEQDGVKEGQNLFAVTQSQIYHEKDSTEHIHRTPPPKNLITQSQQYPNILSENQSVDGDKSILNIENQLKQEIASLKQEIEKLQKQVRKEKTLRQSYEKHITEIDGKNAQASAQKDKKITELEEQLSSNQDVINKLEYLLKENIKLIQLKDNEIRELENINKEEKQKNEQLNQIVDKLKQEGRSLKSIGLGFQKQQSLVFGSDSESSSPPNSKQKVNIYHSTEIFQSKLKQIEQKLFTAQTINKSLVQSQSSLENRLMYLSQESKIKESLKAQNQELKNKLEKQFHQVKDLSSKKEQIQKNSKKAKEEAQRNLEQLVKLFQEQKKKQTSNKIAEITEKLEDNLKKLNEQKQQLKKEIQILKQENSSYGILNQQLESQIKSHMDLTYHLSQTINQQQITIEKNEYDEEIKEENMRMLQEKIDVLKSEKQLETAEVAKLKQQIVHLNEYITQMNLEMVRSRIKEKERQIQNQIEAQQKKQAIEKSEEKDQTEIKQLKQKLSDVETKFAEYQKEIQEEDEKNRTHTEQLERKLDYKQEQICILKLQIEQLEESSENVEIEMDLLHKVVSNLNRQIKDKNKVCKELEEQIQTLKNERASIQKEFQKNKQQAAQTKQYIEKIQETVKYLQKQKQQTSEHLVNIQIEYDLNIVNLKNLQKQFETLTKKYQQKQAALAQIAQSNTTKSQQIKQLEQIIQTKNQQLFISNIPSQQDQSQQKHSVQSLHIDKMDKDLSVDKFKENVDQFCQSKIKDYNKEIYELFRRFIVNLAESQLMRDNKKYLQYVLPYFEEIFKYAENKYQNLQKYMNKMQQSINKTPGPQNLRTPEISSSPITNPKNKVEQIKQVSKIKPKSVNLQIQIEQKVQDQEKQKDPNKKSVLLSEDFNDAFSREDEDDDRMSNRYKKVDGVKQTQRSRSKDLGASGVSPTFARSTHSAMQQLQAQQSYKKDIRNLKMKAKQHRRKV